MKHVLFAVILIVMQPLLLVGQSKIGTGSTMVLYTQHCATCHGQNMEGGLGSSLSIGERQFAGMAQNLSKRNDKFPFV